MLGLCAIVLVLMAFAALGSYWISWELQHKEQRPQFRKQVWNDLFRMMGRDRAFDATTRSTQPAIPQQT